MCSKPVDYQVFDQKRTGTTTSPRLYFGRNIWFSTVTLSTGEYIVLFSIHIYVYIYIIGIVERITSGILRSGVLDFVDLTRISQCRLDFHVCLMQSHDSPRLRTSLPPEETTTLFKDVVHNGFGNDVL